MNTFQEIDFDEFIKTYKPILNHIDTNSSFNNTMFETYGEELEFVKSQSPENIWTYFDLGDGELYIWSGWSFVNRIGYFVTEIPFDINTDIQVNLGDD